MPAEAGIHMNRLFLDGLNAWWYYGYRRTPHRAKEPGGWDDGFWRKGMDAQPTDKTMPRGGSL